MTTNVSELKEYLNTLQTKHPLPWKAVEAKSEIAYTFTNQRTGETKRSETICEDDCIVDANREEVLGCSEWLRVDWEVLVFLANSPEVIKNLIETIENK